MILFYQEYLERLQDLHAGIQKELAGLPAEALDWVPASGMNSLSVLVVHLTGSERYWIGDVVIGESSDRDREAEFRASGLDVSTLTRRLDDALNYARAALERLNLADLDRQCLSPRSGKQFSAAWALLHALEHTAIHLGHIQLTRQLWDERS
jgi:uncharacterized damage-inducible protein DinB